MAGPVPRQDTAHRRLKDTLHLAKAKVIPDPALVLEARLPRTVATPDLVAAAPLLSMATDSKGL